MSYFRTAFNTGYIQMEKHSIFYIRLFVSNLVNSLLVKIFIITKGVRNTTVVAMYSCLINFVEKQTRCFNRNTVFLVFPKINKRDVRVTGFVLSTATGGI